MKIPIPVDWDGETWCRWAVCWPDSVSWRAVLLGFLTLPARGRFWDETTGSIVGIQAVGREIRDENLELREVLMACGDSGIQAIADAIASLELSINQPVSVSPVINVGGGDGCACGGCGGAVTINIDGSGSVGVIFDPEDTQPGPPVVGVPDVDPPPDGFDGWADYLDYKCQAARAFVSFALLVNRLLYSALAIQFYAGILANVLLRTLPRVLSWVVAVFGAGFGTQSGTSFWQALVRGNGALVATASVVYSYIGLLATAESVLSAYIDYVEENQEDLVCRLYNANSVGDAYAEYLAFIDEAVTFVDVPADVATVIGVIVDILYPSSVLNPLFENVLSGIGGFSADCSECAGDCPAWLGASDSMSGYEPEYDGIVADNMDGSYSIEAVPLLGGYICQNWYNIPPQTDWTFEVESGDTSPHPEEAYRPIWKLYRNYEVGGAGSENVWSHNDTPPVKRCNFLVVASANPFTIRVTCAE